MRRNPSNIRQETIIKLLQDTELVQLWCNLFSSNSCEHSGSLISGSDDDSDEEGESLQISEDQELLDYEFEQCLVLQLMEKVITYMSSVHLSDLLGTYKDNKLSVKKSLSIRHSLGSALKKDIIGKEIPFPCAVCKKECVYVEAMRKPSLEDFSVLCELCDKWFHYICIGLKCDEEELKEGSDTPYYCPNCKSLKSSDCSGGTSDIHVSEICETGETPSTSKRKCPVKKSSKKSENPESEKIIAFC